MQKTPRTKPGLKPKALTNLVYFSFFLLLFYCSLFLVFCEKVEGKELFSITEKKVAFQVLNAADFLITRDKVKNGGREFNNLFVGKHPSDQDLLLWWGLSSVGHWLITDYVMQTRRAKHWFCNGTLAIKAGCLVWNFTY